MTPAALLRSAKSLIDSDPDAAGLIDRCDVIRVTTTVDDYGGVTASETTLAADVPCLYEERIYTDQRVAGMATNYVSHNLFLQSTAVTRLIQPHYKIVVAARDDNSEMTFEDPVRLDESLSPLVCLGATLKP